MRRQPIFARFLVSGVLLTGTAVVATQNVGIAAPLSQTFEAINSQDYFTVPTGVTRLTIDIGAGSDNWGGGLGGRVVTDISVTPGEILEVVVGSRGDAYSGRGGWPDGGDGGGQVGNSNASGGGGSTSIKTASNSSIIAIAGAGGGGSNFTQAGDGGFPWGEDAIAGYTGYGYMDGKGATQSAGGAGGCEYDTTCSSFANGSFHQGGHATIGGGGGGGYYGGGAGGGGIVGYDTWSASGGGGSSWVDANRIFSGTSVTYQPGYFPSNVNEWRNGNGYAKLTWTPAAATTTTASSTTSISPTSSSSSTTSTSTSTSTTPSTIPQSTTTTPPPATTIAPTWTSQPENEREQSVIGRTPFPISGVGSVVVVNEGGYVVNARNVFMPRWRTRVYIGSFTFSLKAAYISGKKKKTYACTFPRFGTETKVLSSRKWRWYSPPRGCTLPKELVTQLAQGKTTMQFTGSFTRKWATTGKTTRPDGSRIQKLTISLVIAGSESVAVN